MKNKPSGFTLTELVVVILTFGLLTVFALPLFANFQVDGKTTGCRNNLRQIGMIMHTYARDHAEGEFPLWQDRNIGGLNNQWPFSKTVQHLATGGYVDDTHMWVCPADMTDGALNNITMAPAPNFDAMGRYNISYVFVAGHRLNGPENGAIVPMLADESNQTEHGASTPGAIPALTADDNHGAEYRNILFLDGHVGVVTGTAVNAIYDGFVDSANVQLID